ncbi:MAG TPA: hypothetical protein VL049_30070 [Candidatus Dormibacteraeota bacterium]|nr:hypothetical protein [Candidatus Dormibacteraeota bacterium]
MQTTGEQETAASPPSDGARGSFLSAGLSVIDGLMAGGELLPAQLPAATHWTPEKKLAAAVLASALVEIRDHHGSPAHRRRVAEALEWVALDDGSWAFSFVRLCELFSLEVEWVRGVVARWVQVRPEDRKGISFLYRQAA